MRLPILDFDLPIQFARHRLPETNRLLKLISSRFLLTKSYLSVILLLRTFDAFKFQNTVLLESIFAFRFTGFSDF